GRRLAAVVNETPRALEDAFVVDDHGEIYVVGDLAPGARAAIPRRSRGAIAIGYDYPSADAAGRALAAAVGLDEARIPYAGGLITLAPLATGVPALYARATTEPAPLGPFAPEHDERWLRVAAR